jgi:hypothetical protein
MGDKRFAGLAAEILESIPGAVVAIDRDWRLVYLNHHARHALDKPW